MLHEKFCDLIKHQSGLKILNISENLPTKIRALKLNLNMVDKQSAFGTKHGHKTFCNCTASRASSYLLNLNHFVICKPETRQSMNYMITVEFTKSIIRDYCKK